MWRRRRRVLYWPLALLILAVGMCGRVQTPTSRHESREASRSSPAQAAVPKKRAHAEPALPDDRKPQTAQETNASTISRTSRSQTSQLRLRVVGVHDGDTLTGIDDNHVQHKIRLDAIDAPELGQAYGQAAKKALSGKVFGKDIQVVPKTTDRYGRTVGHILIDGRDVNLEMLVEGMAWHYKQYDHNTRLREAEQSARSGKKGLWQDSYAVPPWEHRKEHHHTKRPAGTN